MLWSQTMVAYASTIPQHDIGSKPNLQYRGNNYRPTVDPSCLVPRSCFGYAPGTNGSKRAVGYQVVGVHWGSMKSGA